MLKRIAQQRRAENRQQLEDFLLDRSLGQAWRECERGSWLVQIAVRAGVPAAEVARVAVALAREALERVGCTGTRALVAVEEAARLVERVASGEYVEGRGERRAAALESESAWGLAADLHAADSRTAAEAVQAAASAWEAVLGGASAGLCVLLAAEVLGEAYAAEFVRARIHLTPEQLS